MRWRMALALGVALTMLPGTAWASHMGNYQNIPVEHDAQGTVLEPDGVSTSVLGPTVVNTVLDLPPFDGRGTPDPVPKPSGALGSAIAPGCSGGAAPQPERRLDGQCALWSAGAQGQGAGVVPAPLSERGMAGNAAPGGYTPTKGHTIRFLDARFDAMYQAPNAPALNVDQNRKVSEAQRLSGTDLPGEEAVFPGQNYVWAWYGQWTDLNGNGVVDHMTPNAAANRLNEFAFLGGCLNFDGARDPLSIQLGTCVEDPNPNIDPPGTACADPASVVGCAGTSLTGWFFPGSHHQNGIADDFPGQQLVNFALLLGNCAGPPSCDDIDRDQFADPLLGRQDEVRFEVPFGDRTGDMDGDTARQWAGGGGWASYFYGDDGMLVTMVGVFGVNCAPSASAHGFDLGKPAGAPGGCTFADVDRHTTIHPQAEELLVGDPADPNGGLKSTARSAWLIVRDGAGLDTFQRRVDSLVNSRDVYLASQGPLQGTLDDLALQAGWSREPNAPGDQYLGTTYGACSALPVGDPRNPTSDLDAAELEAQHRGWCNVGTGGLGTAYAAYRQGPARGFLDSQAVRNAFFSVPIQPIPTFPCVFCVYGITVDVPFTPEPGELPPSAEDHGRTLGPGAYWWAGAIGTWADRAATRDESLFPDPVGTTLVTYPADGWVGLVERASGQWRYRGYLPLECTTEQDLAPRLREAAECNPYLDGNIEDPQDYTLAAAGGEFTGACDASNLFFTIEPADGEMDTQVLVYREHGQPIAPDPLDLDGNGDSSILHDIDAYGPGPVGPLVLGASCNNPALWWMNDYLIWPQGNLGDVIVSRMTKSIQLGADVDGDGVPDADTITDVDVYAAYGV